TQLPGTDAREAFLRRLCRRLPYHLRNDATSRAERFCKNICRQSIVEPRRPWRTSGAARELAANVTLSAAESIDRPSVTERTDIRSSRCGHQLPSAAVTIMR